MAASGISMSSSDLPRKRLDPDVIEVRSDGHASRPQSVASSASVRSGHCAVLKLALVKAQKERAEKQAALQRLEDTEAALQRDLEAYEEAKSRASASDAGSVTSRRAPSEAMTDLV